MTDYTFTREAMVETRGAAWRVAQLSHEALDERHFWMAVGAFNSLSNLAESIAIREAQDFNHRIQVDFELDELKEHVEKILSGTSI